MRLTDVNRGDIGNFVSLVMKRTKSEAFFAEKSSYLLNTLNDVLREELVKLQHEQGWNKLVGIHLEYVDVGTSVEFTTKNTTYTITKQSNGTWTVRGNDYYFPPYDPNYVKVNGSTWGGSMLKTGFIGVGMHVEMVPLQGDRRGHRITTTPVQSLRLL